MKRCFSVLVSVVLLLTCLTVIPASAATSIDYSVIRSGTDFFDFDIRESGDAFIELKYNVPKFTHKNSPDGYPSLMYSDIIVADYYTNPRLAWRVFIDYAAEKGLGVSSVTFSFGGTDFTFDVAQNVELTRNDDCVVESIPILMGSENYVFWGMFMIVAGSKTSASEVMEIPMTVTLHGAIDDVTFEAPAESVLFMFFMGKTAQIMVGTEGIRETTGTPVTNITTPSSTEAPAAQ